MKKIVVFGLLTCLLIIAMGAYLETFLKEWSPIRSLVVADDLALDGTTAARTYAFADKPVLAVRLNERSNAGELYFYGKGDDTDTAAFKVYAWKSNGPAKLLYQGTCALGPAVTGVTDTFYCDTVTEVANYNNCTVTDSGNNRIAILNIGDLKGYSWLYVEFDVTIASLITSVNCDFTSY
jgi:hypothetical protein